MISAKQIGLKMFMQNFMSFLKKSITFIKKAQ